MKKFFNWYAHKLNKHPKTVFGIGIMIAIVIIIAGFGFGGTLSNEAMSISGTPATKAAKIANKHFKNPNNGAQAQLAAAITLSQMLTEILNNVYRHVQSQNVTIVVKVAEDKLKMIVTDFGIGFDQNQEIKKNHYGLSGLKNNIKNLYGTLTINSAVDEGTSIIVEIPLEVAKEGE